MVIIAEEGERQLAEKYFPGQEIRITGVGALNLLKSLRDLPLSTPIINIGYVGSANYAIGSLVEIGESVDQIVVVGGVVIGRFCHRLVHPFDLFFDLLDVAERLLGFVDQRRVVGKLHLLWQISDRQIVGLADAPGGRCLKPRKYLEQGRLAGTILAGKRYLVIIVYYKTNICE